MRNFVLLLTFLFVCKTDWALDAQGKIILKPYLSRSVAGLSNFRVYNFLISFNLTSAEQRHLPVICELLYLMCYEPAKHH